MTSTNQNNAKGWTAAVVTIAWIVMKMGTINMLEDSKKFSSFSFRVSQKVTQIWKRDFPTDQNCYNNFWKACKKTTYWYWYHTLPDVFENTGLVSCRMPKCNIVHCVQNEQESSYLHCRYPHQPSYIYSLDWWCKLACDFLPYHRDPIRIGTGHNN